jgi:hypothetical protein
VTGFESKSRRPTGRKGFSQAGFHRKEIFCQQFVALVHKTV